MPERTYDYSAFWAVLAVVAVLLVAWLVWSASQAPGVPNTGTEVQMQAPAPAQ